MTNGFEHTMEMADSGLLSTDGSSTDDNRVVLLYGGGNETGLTATQQFLETGANVVIADEPEYRQVVRDRFGADVDFLDIDPQRLGSIETVSAQFKEAYDDIDVLASTKSAAYPPGSDSGPDRTYAVNHLALYCLYHHFEDMMYRCRTLVPIHPIIDDRTSWDGAPDDTVSAFARSQYANAALVVAIHIQRWDRTINGYDPGIVVNDDAIPASERIEPASEPDGGAARLTLISGDSTAAFLRGGYYESSIEKIEPRLEDFSDEFNRWDISTPEFHKLPLSQKDAEAVLKHDTEVCGFEPDWYKTDAWWLNADRGPVGY